MDLPSDRKEDLKTLLFTTLGILAVTLVIFSYLWRNIQMSTLKYEIASMQKEKKKLFLAIEQKRLNVAQKSTITKLDQVIRGKFGYLPIKLSKKNINIILPKIKNQVN